MKKRIVAFLLLSVMILIPFTQVFAISVSGQGKTMHWGSTGYYTKIIKDNDGNYVYCVDPHKKLPKGEDFNLSNDPLHQRQINILKYGYPLDMTGLTQVSLKTPKQYYMSTWIALNVAVGNFKGVTLENAYAYGDSYLNALLDNMDKPLIDDNIFKPASRNIGVSKNDTFNHLESDEIKFIGNNTSFQLSGFVNGVCGRLKIVDADTRQLLRDDLKTNQRFRIATDLGYSGRVEVVPVGHGFKKVPEVKLQTGNNDVQVVAFIDRIGGVLDVKPIVLEFRGGNPPQPEPKPNVNGQISKKDVEDGYGVNGAEFRIVNDGRFTKTPETTDDDGNIVPATYYEAGEYTINVTTGNDGTASYELPEYSGETTWSVRETTAPNGYYKSEDGEQSLGGNIFKNKRQKGKITITKVDNENSYINHNDKTKPQGDGQLDGAVFEIIAEEDIVLPNISNKVVHKKGDVVETLVIKNGRAESSLHELGTYKVVERQLPEGYWYENYQKKFTPFITSISSLFILI